MKRNFHFPLFARGAVIAAVLASFVATASSRVHAQVTVYRTQYNGYYNPYGQGPYAGYGQDTAYSPQARGAMFPGHTAMVGSRPYGNSGSVYVPSGYSDRFDYGNGSRIRVYEGTSYYQPFFGAVYVPFGYSNW